MKQALLDFGADFEADLARAAEWIEKNLAKVRESITLLKQGRKLSGKKRKDAERLGITTATQEGTEEMLRDLEQLRAQFELIGSYPDLVAQAQMWDGVTEVDPVGRYLERARAEREQAAAEGEMGAEEYLAEQARKEAAEAVPALFSMQMEKVELKPNQIKVRNKAIVTFNDGVVRDARARVLRSDGREAWARFPEIQELKDAGFPGADVFLEVGSLRGGFLHLAIRHGEEIQALYPGVPLFNAIELFVDEVFSNLGKARGSYVGKGKKRKLDADSIPYETSSGEKKKKRVSLSFHKAPDAQFYTVDTAFEAAEDKDFARVKVEKDGLSCTVTVELDGKAPGLPTSATLNPPSAWPLHARRPSGNENITPASNVKGEDIDFEFLRKVKHPDDETGGRVKGGRGGFSANMNHAKHAGLFHQGHLEAVNAVVTEPGVSFNIEALHASPHSFRKFTTEKMGTGEGHQAYGWGLYFAESEEVNKNYYGRFSTYRERYVVDGKEMEGLDGYKRLYNEMQDILLSYGGDELYMNEMSFLLGQMSAGYSAAELRKAKLHLHMKRKAYKDAYDAALSEMQERGLGVKRVDMPATNYRVELNVDDSNLLHFDQYVSEDFLESFIAANPDLSDFTKQKLRTKPWDRPATFEDFYYYLASGLDSKKAASEMLAAHGYKGIKYLDGTSRSEGEGTYNYVIFSGDDIKITGVNESGDYNAPWEAYEDTTASFSMSGEMEQIRAAAVADGTFMKAPNGKPSRLTERQWLQVRTKAFKGWFGDWERAAELTFDGSECNNETCLAALAAEAGKPFVNDETGIEAEINNRQRGKITSGKAQRKSRESGFSTGVHNYVASHIRRLFKHAVHVGDYRDKNASADVLAIKRFVCPVRIDGVSAFAYMTVKELKQHGHKIYTLELDTIERLGGNLDEHFEEMLNPAPSKDIVARVEDLSKTFFENVSKVVDENGEPLVVTHATNSAPFTVFKKGERPGLSGRGIYFSPDGVTIWGSNVMRCFLNVRNPLTRENAPREVNNGGMSAVIPDVFEKFPEFDGVMIRRDEITVRDPEQIKSATDNRGTFDGGEADITFSVIGPSAKTWDKYPDSRKFKGRDDGKMRVEIDASGAKLRGRSQKLEAEIESRNVQLRRDWPAAEREATPFNETLEYPGEALVSFSVVHVPLYQEILDTFEQRIGKDGSAVWVSRKEKDGLMVICPYPDVLNQIIPWGNNVVAKRDVVQKLMNKHSLLPQDVAKLPHALWDPVAVFEDPEVDRGFIVITDILAPNFSPKRKTKKNKEAQVRQMKQVMAVLELRADGNNAMITDIVSAYSADSTEKYNSLLNGGYLRYADAERALMWASAEGDSVLQLRTTALLHPGSGVMLKENMPDVNTNFSSSMEKASLRALEVLRGRADERAGEQLIKDWERACEAWYELAGADDEARLGNGAKMLGEMQALIGATKGVLPERYCRMGHLNGLMRWAGIYARMQQEEVMRVG